MLHQQKRQITSEALSAALCNVLLANNVPFIVLNRFSSSGEWLSSSGEWLSSSGEWLSSSGEYSNTVIVW